MTVMTAYHAEADYDDTDAPGSVCWRCGGPCLIYKGSVHGWTCTACIDRYLDDGAARWAARARNEQERQREKIARNLLLDNDNRTSVNANGQRQEGGGSELCAAPPSGADRQERAAAPRFVPRGSDDQQEGLT